MTGTGWPLEELYRSHGHLVVRRARRLLGSEDEAHDVLHDIFAGLADRPEQFRGESSFATWLYARTTRACLDRLRTRRRRSDLLAIHGSSASDPLAADASPQSSATLRRLLEKLPEDLAPVAVYQYLDGMTHAEMAEALGCSRRQVATRLARLARLWACLQKEA